MTATAHLGVVLQSLVVWAGLQVAGALLAFAARRNDRRRGEERTGGLRHKFLSYLGITLGVMVFGWLPEEVFHGGVALWLTMGLFELDRCLDEVEDRQGGDLSHWRDGGILLLVLSFACLELVRGLDVAGGYWAFLWIVVGTTDAYSQLFGQGWGRTPLAPRWSPKKTWEGFLGGTVCAVLAGVSASFALPGLGILCVALLALTVSLAASLGDLAESAAKRTLQIKDFSDLLGTHGGMLDRFDSLFVAAWVYAPLLLWLRP